MRYKAREVAAAAAIALWLWDPAATLAFNGWMLAAAFPFWLVVCRAISGRWPPTPRLVDREPEEVGE